MDGHHARTVRSLVQKGYMEWTLVDEREAKITNAGREWVRSH
jgi:hypothetical protein